MRFITSKFIEIFLLDFEDEIFIQFSEERTLKWLELKFDKIKKSVKNNSIGKSQTGFQINDYVSGDVSEGMSTFGDFNVGVFVLDIFYGVNCIVVATPTTSGESIGYLGGNIKFKFK